MSRAFSLVELLIVMVVVAILAGMLIPAAAMAFDARDRFRTLASMDSLKIAVVQYMGNENRLGEPLPNGNIPSPLTYLHHQVVENRRAMTLRANQVIRDVSGTLNGPFLPCGTVAEGTHLVDGYNGPILLQVRESAILGAPGLFKATTVLMRSLRGGAAPGRQIMIRLDLTDNLWKECRLIAIEPDGQWNYTDK